MLKIPITQSAAWKKLQDDLKEKSFLVKEKNFQYLAILKTTPVGNYLYCPYGPVAEEKSDFKHALESLKNLGKENNCIFIRIEPTNEEYAKFLPKNAKKSKDLNPKDTWVLDLTPEKSEIIANFSQGTRTRYNTYAKKGLSVKTTKDPAEISHLVELQNKLYKAKNLSAFSEEYLKTELKQPFASLFLVEYHKPANVENSENLPKDGQILAASLFFDYEGTRYYMQSAADSDFKRLPATVALLTTAIFDAKDQGIKKFDFWGIAPDNAPKNHPWAGFTEFKKSFGGSAIHYAGDYDIILSKKYTLYQIFRKINRLIRK